MPTDRVIDGKDIFPLMAGEAGARTPHEAFFFHRGMRLEAVRGGKWKLHLSRTVRPRRKKGQPKPEARKTPPQLYDLRADISEKNNVADQHPEVVQRLTALARTFTEDLAKTRREPGRVEDGGKK